MGMLSRKLGIPPHQTGVLPSPGMPCSVTLPWWGKDSPERYKEKGGHPLYGPDDIRYSFNSLGYRCPEFTVQAPVRIASFGCSYVAGDAVRQTEVFHEIVARHLERKTGKKVVNWNLGSGGTSNDFLARSMNLAIPLLDPQIVLVSFTFPDRREFVNAEGEIFHVISKRGEVATRSGLRRGQLTALDGLISGCDDLLNFYRAYSLVSASLKDRVWLFTSINPEILTETAHLIDQRRCVGPFPRIDFGRDHAHPGPESHARLAELFIARLEAEFQEELAAAGVQL